MNYMECEVDAIILGSLGTIHKKVLKVLMDTGMPKSKAKGLLKWSSTSSIIGRDKFGTYDVNWLKEAEDLFE